jgi:hypothetical protein
MERLVRSGFANGANPLTERSKKAMSYLFFGKGAVRGGLTHLKLLRRNCSSSSTRLRVISVKALL